MNSLAISSAATISNLTSTTVNASNLVVSGTFTANTLNISNITTTGSITCSGLSNIGNMTLNGAMTCTGNLTVSDTIILTGSSSRIYAPRIETPLLYINYPESSANCPGLMMTGGVATVATATSTLSNTYMFKHEISFTYSGSVTVTLPTGSDMGNLISSSQYTTHCWELLLSAPATSAANTYITILPNTDFGLIGNFSNLSLISPIKLLVMHRDTGGYNLVRNSLAYIETASVSANSNIVCNSLYGTNLHTTQLTCTGTLIANSLAVSSNITCGGSVIIPQSNTLTVGSTIIHDKNTQNLHKVTYENFATIPSAVLNNTSNNVMTGQTTEGNVLLVLGAEVNSVNPLTISAGSNTIIRDRLCHVMVRSFTNETTQGGSNRTVNLGSGLVLGQGVASTYTIAPAAIISFLLMYSVDQNAIFVFNGSL